MKNLLSRAWLSSLVLAALLALVGGCSDRSKSAPALTALPATSNASTVVANAAPTPDTPLQIGDSVAIKFTDVSGRSPQDVIEQVRLDGSLALPYNVIVKAAGKTLSQLGTDIRDAYIPKYYTRMIVTVERLSPSSPELR